MDTLSVLHRIVYFYSTTVNKFFHRLSLAIIENLPTLITKQNSFYYDKEIIAIASFFTYLLS